MTQLTRPEQGRHELFSIVSTRHVCIAPPSTACVRGRVRLSTVGGSRLERMGLSTVAAAHLQRAPQLV